MKRVSLTFDDGPWIDTTPKVIEVLERYDLPATFMIWGQHALKYPNLLKREAQNAKFSFGNHTLNHVHLTGLKNVEIHDEILENDNLINALIGRIPNYIRPPFGEYNENVVNCSKGRPLIIWSLDTRSWEHHSSSQVLKQIDHVQDGDVILMHDFQKADADALEDVIKTLQAKNFEISSLKSLFEPSDINNKTVVCSRSEYIE